MFRIGRDVLLLVAPALATPVATQLTTATPAVAESLLYSGRRLDEAVGGPGCGDDPEVKDQKLAQTALQGYPLDQLEN